MQVTVIGCAGSFPGPDSPSSCYLIEHAGSSILLDLGNGALGSLQRHVDLASIDAVLLTHLHVDHCIDMTSFYVFRNYHPGGALPSIPVFGPEGTAEQLARAYGMADDAELRRRFDFGSLGDGAGGPAAFELGPFTITTTPTVHPIESYAIRVDAGGGSVVYSGDTAPTPALIDLAQGADIALFEASYLDGAPADAVHMTARQAGEDAAAAGVAHLVLTHLVAWNDPALSAEQGSAGFGREVTIATSGLTLSL